MGGPGSGGQKGKRGPQQNPKGCSQPCGTFAKYQYHRRRGEDCTLCKEANRDRSRIKQGYQGLVRRTPKERKSAVNNFLIQQQFLRVGCLDCGLQVTERNLCVFDWNHRVPSEKLFTIGEKKHHKSIADLTVEIAKCDLLCANCHRMETQKQRHEGVLGGQRMPHESMLTLFDLQDLHVI